MPHSFDKHIFVCTNDRPDRPDFCCAPQGAKAVLAAFKEQIKKLPATSLRVRANASGCLDACAYGVVVVIYPEGLWYKNVTANDVPEILQTSVLSNGVVERLAL
jgi:(2Fe-2S) ferredoxin